MDLWPATRHQTLLEAFVKNPEADCVIGRIRLQIEEGAILIPALENMDGRLEPMLSMNTALYRRRILDRVGLFDETMNFSEDTDYLFRLQECNYRYLLCDMDVLISSARNSNATCDIPGRQQALLQLIRRKREKPAASAVAPIMRVSATIIAAYNAEPYVRAAIESVLAQTSPPEEIIVVDDGSTDGTAASLTGFAGLIKVVHTEHAGPARALNIGLKAAAGDAFAFLDADDLWMPDKLLRQQAALLADARLEAVFGGIQQFASPELTEEGPKHIFHIRKTPIRRDQDDPADPSPCLRTYRSLCRNILHGDFVEWYARFGP